MFLLKLLNRMCQGGFIHSCLLLHVLNMIYQGDKMLTLLIYKLCFQSAFPPPINNLLFFYSCMAAHSGC